MAEKQTFILGLIGGVGAGKSTVLTLLKDHYGFLCDSDRSYGQEAFGAGGGSI